MQKTPRRKRIRMDRGARNSILMRILLPIMLIMLVQSFLHVAFLWQGVVVTHADQTSYDILSGNVSSRRSYLENEMTHKWSRLSETEYAVIEELESGLAAASVKAQAIKTDARLNAKLVERIVPKLIYMLRKNMVTGAFVVLDGPGLSNDARGTTRAGFYVRDLDPTTYSASNTDLMVQCGMPDISKRSALAFDSCWRPTFEFEDVNSPDARFFFEPLNAALEQGATQSALYGYWSSSYRLDPQDIPVISYSIPLILSDGSIVGVMGVDITQSHLNSLLKYEELLDTKDGSYFLGMTRDGGATYARVTANGPTHRRYMHDSNTLTLGTAVRENLFSLCVGSPNGTTLLAQVSPLRLYDENTPFSDEHWALIGLVPKGELLNFSTRLFQMSLITAVISLSIGMVCVFFVSRMTTRPITDLVTSLQSSDPTRPVQLPALGIREIDELTGSIETLSASVAEASSRITKILSMTKASVGVFEYAHADDMVFCSTNLSDVLCWPETTLRNGLLDRALFDERMAQMSALLYDAGERLYKLTPSHGVTRWVQLTLLEENGRTLGAASDVTSDVMKKQRIEYERDYDLLTNLFNRRAFNNRLFALFSPDQQLGHCALVMWDLDDLKYMNDTYGHDVGDRYIMTLADCLRFFMEEGSGLVSRRSGDEFYTFLYGYPSREAVQHTLDEGWARIKGRSFLLPGDLDYRMRVSGGVAWYPEDTTDCQELMRFADYAMYNVKRTTKGDLMSFDRAAYLRDEAALYGTEALNRLIAHELVEFAMQPIFDVENDCVYGYEMLMRPQVEHFKTPMDLIHAAQVHSKLHHIERITWLGAMKTFAKHVSEGHIENHVHVFINSIASQVLTSEDLKEIERNFTPYLSRVVLEVIEIDKGTDATIDYKCRTAKAWGGQIAIDDFGVGYNNEAFLVLLAPDLVKLDMSIVRNIDHDANRQDTLYSLLAYTKAHGMRVVAEGVETEDEMRLLTEIGVTLLQGYYIGRPAFDISPIAPEVRRAINAAAQRSAR